MMNKTVTVLFIRIIYSETEVDPLDFRVYRQWCREAGIQTAWLDKNQKLHYKRKFSPSDVRKFKEVHGCPIQIENN